MKKLIALLLALTMVFGLVACGTNEEPEVNANEPAEPVAEQNETPKEVTTLTWYVPGDPQADTSLVMEKVNEITVPAIGAKVDMKFIDTGSWKEKMNMMMTGQEVFDIVWTGYLDKYADTVAKGGLLKLDELLATVPALEEQVPDYLWDAATINGGIYAVPNEQVTANQYVPCTFKDLADEYGLDYENVTSYLDLEDYFAWIKENHPEMLVWRFNSGEFTIPNAAGTGDIYEEVADGIGFRIGDPTCTVQFYYDSDEWQAGIAKRAEWLEKGYIREDVLSVGDDSVDYNAGKYAVWQIVYKPGVEATQTAKYGREVVAMKNVGRALTKTANCISTLTGISRTSQNPELAIKLIELVNTNKELYNLICFGIEGTHYTLNEEGKAVVNEEGGWNLNAGDWKIGCQFNALVREGQNDDVWEETKALNDAAAISQLMGFTLDKDPISTEWANYSAVLNEYKFVAKGLSLDYMDYQDEYHDKLEASGLDVILTEVQKQIDEFLASK